ncbi:MAG: hydroxyacid dehydrogenase [Treponema sp.]|jgi:uncharacterized protein YgbK (DUF1537 family)|nr:hydroxyacid dehydrogenase [Treponema sp.]
MQETEILLPDMLARYAAYPVNAEKTDTLIADEIKKNKRKIIVLDDDPTGVQTVHGISVYTGWTGESIAAGFDETAPLFFILTNSRGMTATETAKVHADIGTAVAHVAREKKRDFILISRSDSTLRGHYPLETSILKRIIEAESGTAFDGEIICPFFIEGGRYTAGNIHYVLAGDILIPAARTEFAKDKTFGYHHSDLTEWVEEKTGGSFPAKSVTPISIEDLRRGGVDRAAAILMDVHGFGKVILNALDYTDIKIFCTALFRVLDRGKRFIFRSAAAIPRVLGGVSGRSLLSRNELIDSDNKRGGLVVIGSHVKKTTRQLEVLLEKKNAVSIEFNTHLVLDDDRFNGEIRRVQELCNEALDAGKTTVIFTARNRFDLNTGNKEDELRVAVKIAGAVTSFVSNLSGKPRFIIAKGGITSSEIGTNALKVKKALVLGQVLPGIPVWLTGPESRFPNTPYIIFPGNVGDENSLKTIVDMLE